MSCLFDSLSKYVRDTSGRELRSVVCDYLAAKKPLFSDDALAVDDAYVEAMRRDDTFGGAIEIAAFCNVFNVRVIVHNERDGTPPIEFNPLTNAPRAAVVIRWQGNHYEPM